MGIAMQQTKQSTPFRSGATHASSPVLMVGAKPVKPWLVLTAVLFGFFMAVLDMNIMNIAIPSIQTALKADLLSTSWVLNAYNLMYAVLLITVGRFADQYGRKRLLLIAMILFSLASLGCALAQACGRISGAPAMGWLIGFRVLQGIGAAGLTPVSLAIMMVVFPRQKRGAAISVWGAVGGMGAAFGPIIGGFLVQTFDWRWIFLVNLPICAVGIVLTLLFVPETSDPAVSRHIDVPGLLTLTMAIFCLVLAIIEGNEWGWSSVPILSLSQVPHAKLGVGSGVFNTFRLIGSVLGVAILVSVLTGQLHTNLEQAYHTAGALAHAPVIDAFRTTWLFAALCAVIGFVSALLISAMHRPLTRKEIPADETENA